MAGETKNQHYVPRSYLDRFSQGHSNRICVFNLCEDKILPRQLSRNYASRRFFYDVSKEELLILLKSELELFPEFVNHPSLDDPQYIEHILGKNEGDVKIIFDNIIANPDLIENKEYKLKVIIFFMFWDTE
ncbi:MAG: DUF4238 domain-containing protein [Lachnospiraceae bacterium]|nr:DUF4238 domain-containing protein [Lachnospiraceae bacterium]